MKIGKLPEELLEKLVIDKINFQRDDVIARSGIGEDTAIIDPGSDYVALSCDPITGATRNIGKLAVHINCNDLVTSGGEPMGLIVCLLFPPSVNEETIRQIMEDMNREGAKIGVEVIGGHTEITDTVNQTVIITTVIGKVPKNRLMNRTSVKPGDYIVMSKTSGLEGTAIIAYEKESELKDVLSPKELKRAQKMMDRLSVLPEGKAAVNHHVKYMHDVTEGGILGAVWELGRAVHRGVTVEEERIPVTEETKKICAHFNIDPLKLISSGSMLFVFSPEDFEKFKDDPAMKEIPVSLIGTIRDDKKRVSLTENGEIPLKAAESDHLYRVI